MQPLCKFALKTNAGDFARRVFFPSLFSVARGEGNGLLGSFRELAQKWRNLRRRNLQPAQQNAHRHELARFFPRRTDMSEMEGMIARFLSFAYFEFHDYLWLERSRGQIVNQGGDCDLGQ